MQVFKEMRPVLQTVCLSAVLIFSIGACDDGGGNGLDDGLGPEGQAPSMCDSYPAADNTFNMNSVIRNYEFYDMGDDDKKVCEFAKAGKKLMFLAITAES